MSRSIRSRTPATIIPSTPELPPLRCRVFDKGKRVEPSVRPDPREAFCRSFNEQSAEFGFRAEPMLTYEVDLPPLCCGIFTPDGKLERITEMPDPRERYCQTWNELHAGECYARPLDNDELAIASQILAEREGGAK